MNDKQHEAEMRRKMKKTGYKSPPVEFQFKKGQSGNPSGRPKGSKSLKTMIAEALDRETTVRTDEGRQKMTWREAQAIKSHQASLNGNIQYTRLVIACEEEYLHTQTDHRGESERQADIARRMLLAFLDGPDDLISINENGDAVDKAGKVWSPEEIQKRKPSK
jgi:hypothetical protein